MTLLINQISHLETVSIKPNYIREQNDKSTDHSQRKQESDGHGSVRVDQHPPGDRAEQEGRHGEPRLHPHVLRPGAKHHQHGEILTTGLVFQVVDVFTFRRSHILLEMTLMSIFRALSHGRACVLQQSSKSKTFSALQIGQISFDIYKSEK